MQMEQQPEQTGMERGLQSLIDKVPGGMFSCAFDAPLTLLQMNEGFLAILGYTQGEIQERYRNSFWEMIDPRDRTRALDEVNRQMALGPTKELEYRMARKDGSVIWVLDKGRLIQEEDFTYSFSCLLVDITRSKDLESKLRLSLERHQIIMDQAADIILEWDIKADTFYFSPNWEKKFGYPPLTRDVSLYLASSAHICEEDRSCFIELLEQIKRGTRYAEAEVRLMKTSTANIWCRVRLTGQQDESGQVVKAVGVIVDIDAEKRQAQRLLESAQRDALTKLYNKGTVQEIITELLAQRDPTTYAAMFILDLDNFKTINDTLGHLFGDALLIESSHAISLQFREQDTIGRVGGDEFIVFLHSLNSRAVAETKAAQLIKAFSAIQVKELASGAISCSVGVAICPDCGESYRVLFQCADEALYQAKKLGKGQYVVRDPVQQYPVSPLSNQPLSAISAHIDSEEEFKSVGGHFSDYIFHILYKSVDIEAAVNSILEIVGRSFNVSRVYIFENTDDDLYCHNTFEWCNDGVAPEIQNLQHLSYQDDLDDLIHNFNEDGVFYCRDIHMLSPSQYSILDRQGIKSILQCAIFSSGVFKGYVGFDECRSIRFWTQEQVDTLSFISKVLSIFLLKQRAQDRAIQNTQAMETILNSQSSWIYIVNPDTFETYYANRKTLELLPDALGKKCHESFIGCSDPCPFCPIRDMDATHTVISKEIYNPKFCVWSSTEASRIQWRGESAVLLTCHDITSLKGGSPPTAASE